MDVQRIRRERPRRYRVITNGQEYAVQWKPRTWLLLWWPWETMRTFSSLNEAQHAKAGLERMNAERSRSWKVVG